MDDLEDSNLQTSRYLVSQKNKDKEKAGTSKEISCIGRSIVDESHIYRLTRKFARIEYPGIVKNVDKALETLGGIYNVEIAIADPYKKLELKFHPENRFNKSCFSDRDNKPGLVIEITKNGDKLDYEIIGHTFLNIKFNKATDFQFLPLLQDDKTNEVEYIHDNVILKKLPSFDFLLSKTNVTQPVLCLPTNFSRYDITHNTLYLNAGEKFNLEVNQRPELFKIFSHKKKKPKYQFRQISYLLNINDSSLEIPTKPKPLALELIKEKLWTEQYKQVKKMFDERPIWSKAAIVHLSKIKPEMSKVVLAAVSYFWSNGPWRMMWARFGVDPRKDFGLRIYQILDFRIRASEGSKIKVKAKRPYGRDSYTQIIRPKRNYVDEYYYILSPDCLPPARQMFYQYCDIKIPEIQDMLQRLPKTLGNLTFNTKTGWLPVNFPEQCREIANRYVMERVRQELMEDHLKSQSRFQASSEKDLDGDQENPLSYSSGMLDKIQKGFRRTLSVAESEDGGTGNTVVLTDDEEDVDMEEIVQSIPASIEENSDSEHLSDDSEYDLDMEAVEEINQLISETRKEVGE